MDHLRRRVWEGKKTMGLRKGDIPCIFVALSLIKAKERKASRPRQRLLSSIHLQYWDRSVDCKVKSNKDFWLPHFKPLALALKAAKSERAMAIKCEKLKKKSSKGWCDSPLEPLEKFVNKLWNWLSEFLRPFAIGFGFGPFFTLVVDISLGE